MLIAYGLVLIAVGMDLKSMRISNRLILVGLGISLVRRFFCEGIAGVFTGMFLISFPVIILYLLFLAGALGAGDIKLFSLIGGFVSFKELTGCILFAFLFGAGFSILKMLFSGTFFSSLKSVGCYLVQICCGKIETYVSPHGDNAKIHFSIAILFGFVAARILYA